MLQYPNIAERLCSALAAKLKDAGAQTVISPALGGLFIGHEVGRALGRRHIFVEKNAAGKLELRRNFKIGPREKVLVVEDVITKGGRVQETIDIVRQARWRGGRRRRIGGSLGRESGFWRAAGKSAKTAHRNV